MTNHTEYPSCYVSIYDSDKIHMVFENEERAEFHLKVCDGKGMSHKCNEIWEKAIVK